MAAMSEKYLFQDEIIKENLDTFVQEIHDEALTNQIYETATFEEKYYGKFLYVDSEDINELAEKISTSISESRIIRNEQKNDIFTKLYQHNGCASIIKDLILVRNELISAICKSRNYCFVDSELDSNSGQMYMHLEFFIATLRPRLPLYGDTPRSLPDPEENDVDYVYALSAEDEDPAEQLDSEAREEIVSHTHCSQIGHELYTHIEGLIGRIEAVYERAKSLSYEKYDEVVTPARDVLPLLKIKPALYEGTNMPKSATATIYPEMDDPDYCMPEGNNSYEYHSYPHRACAQQY
ncbi:hypothetical protein E7Z53_18005 [Kocuria salina]|uniref:hypothetical protein n=1 Tax=Kocuria salina TaxID=1929416 RepID=UPI001594C20E|nr:hypothetical protein [Kocuria salina]NVC25315.1 hypothetical protein [Kocuria salina]